MLIIHKILGTWKSSVDIYIALSDFSRRKFIEGGFPKNKLAVKPNFVSPDPGTGEGHGSYALYVGRLSHEKGIRTMLDAWQQLENIPLVIAGDGPFLKSASKFAEHHRQGEIRVHGHCSNDEVLRLMKGARFLIFPSLCNENSPITIAEAFACGLPVVSSDIGAVAEIVEHRRTGLNFNTGSSDALAEAVRWLWERPEQSSRMRYEARKEYEMKYTAAVNYPLLEEIYSIARRKK
jgi:glycosyltransferase involved in cell wall biosynthesis